LRAALKIDPSIAEAHNTLGAALYDRGLFGQAQAEFARAAKIKPDYALAHYNLGLALGREGKPSEAVPELRRALSLQPTSPDIRMALGEALDADGQTAQARAIYRQIAAAGQGTAAKRARRRLARPQ